MDMPTRSGLYIPETAEEGRYFGRVFGVGEGVDGVCFGDVVELSKWSCAREQGWWRDVPRLMGWDPSGNYILADADDSSRRILANPRDWWLWVWPEQLICRIARHDWEKGRLGPVGTWPMGDRILVHHKAKRKMSSRGVWMVEYDTGNDMMAEVIQTGGGVAGEVTVGDMVLLERRAWGTHFTVEENGRRELYSMVRLRDVMLNCGPRGTAPEVEAV